MPAPFHKQTHPCRLGLLAMGRGSWLAVMVPVSSPPQVGCTERRCGQPVPACVVARDCPWWRFHTYPEPRQMMPHSAHLFYGQLQMHMLSRAQCDHIGTTCERAPCALKPGTLTMSQQFVYHSHLLSSVSKTPKMQMSTHAKNKKKTAMSSKPETLKKHLLPSAMRTSRRINDCVSQM